MIREREREREREYIRRTNEITISGIFLSESVVSDWSEANCQCYEYQRGVSLVIGSIIPRQRAVQASSL